MGKLSTPVKDHIRSNVIGYVALFAFAMSGSAHALSGSGTVDHDDLQPHVIHRAAIHDGAVNSAKVDNESLGQVDLGVGSVGADEVVNNSLYPDDIATGGVGSSEVQENSLTGGDINESTLGKVPSATVADRANSASSTFYDARIPMPNSLDAPPIVTLDVPPGAYLIVSKLTADNYSPVDTKHGICRLRAGGDFDDTWWDAIAGNPSEPGYDPDVISDGSDDDEVVTNQVVHRFKFPGRVLLYCSDRGEGASGAHFTKVTAIQVASVSTVPFSR